MSQSKRLRAKERRGLLDKAMAALKGLGKEELINLRFELGRQINQQQTVINDLRIRLDAVRAELDGREREWDGYRITDHAVVRYLERRKGMDMTEIRREIAEIAKTSRGVNLGRRRHDDLGATIGVDERPGFEAVTTVFFESELPVMATLPPKT